MQHQLKTIQPNFDDLASGRKTFELRKADRNYQVCDTLLLQEYNSETDEYTGKELRFEVTHILTGGRFGLAADYCILSLKRIK